MFYQKGQQKGTECDRCGRTSRERGRNKGQMDRRQKRKQMGVEVCASATVQRQEQSNKFREGQKYNTEKGNTHFKSQ